MYVRRSDPEAYLFTRTGYGTWPHGDERGSVDDVHNIVGAPAAPPDLVSKHEAEHSMRHPAVYLNGAMRVIVEATIADHCRIKKWGMLAVNVRTTHVHAVVDCGDVAMEQLKAWSTRRMRDATLIGHDQPLWARRGSTRYLWEREGRGLRRETAGSGPSRKAVMKRDTD